MTCLNRFPGILSRWMKILTVKCKLSYLVMFLATVIFLVPISGAAAGSTFIFVHGSWVGEWYWEPVIKILKEAGHHASAVSLTGHGKRIDENGPEVTLEDHVNDVVAAIEASGKNDVILVAHSYGGKPGTGAWDRARNKISHVVFVEAVTPINDDIVAIRPDSRSMQFIMTLHPDWVDKGMIPPTPTIKKQPGKPLAPQSFKSVYGAVSLEFGVLPNTPGKYIYARDSNAKVYRKFAEHMKEWRSWNVIEIPGGHDVAGDAPEALADALISVIAN